MRKVLNTTFYIINAILFIVAGICFIVLSDMTMDFFSKGLGVVLLINGFSKILKFFGSSKKSHDIITYTVEFFLNLILGLWFLFVPKLLVNFITVIFGLYIFAQSISNFINFIIYKENKLPGKILLIVTGIVMLVFSFLFILGPQKNSFYFSIVIGIFFIIYGIIFLIKLLPFVKTKFPLPVLFTMLLPKVLIRKIRKGNKRDFNENDEQNIDLEVLIHLAPGGSAGMGHVEFGFEGKIYSYACYNYIGRHLCGGIGDGVIGIHDHDSYIKYCVEMRDRFIISFGLKLNDEQKGVLKEAISKYISTDTTPWLPELALYDKGLTDTKKEKYTEMANELYLYADTKFLRFTKGKYKTFFVFRTNCVVGTDEILGALNLKLFPLEGIITPGTYYKFMDDQYHSKTSPVVSKVLYTKEYIDKKGYQYKKRNIRK